MKTLCREFSGMDKDKEMNSWMQSMWNEDYVFHSAVPSGGNSVTVFMVKKT